MQQRQTTKSTIPEYYGGCYNTEFPNKRPQITLPIGGNWFFFSRAYSGCTSHEPSAILQRMWDHILILLLRCCGFYWVEMKLASTSHKLQYSPDHLRDILELQPWLVFVMTVGIPQHVWEYSSCKEAWSAVCVVFKPVWDSTAIERSAGGDVQTTRSERTRPEVFYLDQFLPKTVSLVLTQNMLTRFW